MFWMIAKPAQLEFFPANYRKTYQAARCPSISSILKTHYSSPAVVLFSNCPSIAVALAGCFGCVRRRPLSPFTTPAQTAPARGQPIPHAQPAKRWQSRELIGVRRVHCESFRGATMSAAGVFICIRAPVKYLKLKTPNLNDTVIRFAISLEL